MIYFIAVGVLVTLLSSRNPMALFSKVEFRHPALIIGALLLQVLLFVVFQIRPYEHAYLLEATMLLLLAGFWLNRRIPGVLVMMAGAATNLASVFIHHGRMPVMEQALRIAGLPLSAHSARHQMMTAGDLWWLGDWIPLFRVVISLGDVLVGFGIIWFIYKNSPKRNNHVG